MPPLAYPVTNPSSVVVFSTSEVGNAIPPGILLSAALDEEEAFLDPPECED
jgi:hypothetical protein